MNRLIVALDRKRGMAKHGGQPWYIPYDEQYFTRLTKSNGGIVLVGSITFQTFKGPLVDRRNFVLTRDKEPIPGVELVRDLDKFLNDYRDQDVWVVGGANVFAQVIEMDKADELYITKIEADFGCQQFFPEYENRYKLAEQSALHEQNGFIYTYCKYVR